MNVREKNMVLSPGWLMTAVITFIFGFTVLGYLAYRNTTDQPPVPKLVRGSDGGVLYTGDDIIQGQHLFQRYGLMQYGTLLGHGAYLGPDFTAQYLHISGERALSSTPPSMCPLQKPRRGCAPSSRPTTMTRAPAH